MNIITLETDWLVLKKVKVYGIEALSIIRKNGEVNKLRPWFHLEIWKKPVGFIMKGYLLHCKR